MRHTEPHDNGYNRVGFKYFNPPVFPVSSIMHYLHNGYPQMLLNMQQLRDIVGLYDSKYRNR